MATPTHTLISSYTVGAGGASSIDFSSIPSIYNDLIIQVSGRSSTGYNAADIYITLNGSSSSYQGRYVMKDSTTATPVSSVSATNKFLLGFIPATQASSSAFGSMTIYLPKYSSSSVYKSISVDSATENNGSIQWIYFAGGLWSSSSVVNQVTITDSSGSFAQHSTAYLYGIKNS